MVLIFFLHDVIVRSCYTSYMKRYLQFSIVVNTFRSPSCLKIWCFVQDIRYVHRVLVQLKLSIKERNTGLKRLRMCMCMLLGCQYQVATKECKSRGFKGVKEFRSVTRIFQSRGSHWVKQRVRARLSCRPPRHVLFEVTKKKLMKGGHGISLPPPLILHPWILKKAPRQNGKSTQLNKFWVRKVLDDFPFPNDWFWIFHLCSQILRDGLIFHEFR